MTLHSSVEGDGGILSNLGLQDFSTTRMLVENEGVRKRGARGNCKKGQSHLVKEVLDIEHDVVNDDKGLSLRHPLLKGFLAPEGESLRVRSKGNPGANLVKISLLFLHSHPQDLVVRSLVELAGCARYNQQ